MTRPDLALLLLFVACSSEPPLPPDFRHSMGGPPMTAAAPLPDKPTVPVRNPFLCPGPAPSPAPPAPRGEGRLP